MIRGDQSDLIYKTEEAKYIAKSSTTSAGVEGASRCSSAPPASTLRYLSRQFRSGAFRTTCSTPSTTNGRPESSRRPAPRRDHRRHQHGRPWHDIVLGGNVDFLADNGCASGLDPVETPELRAAWHGCCRGPGPTRPRRPRTSSPSAASTCLVLGATNPPHRQPAARPLRPPGRPRRVAVLPITRRRADAAVQRRTLDRAQPAESARRCTHRGQIFPRDQSAQSGSTAGQSARTSSSTTR